MAWVNKNFAYSTLDGGVLIGASSLAVAAGEGANFPATGNFMCVIWDQSYSNPSFDADRELVLCTARVTDTISITRAQESTSAKAWNSGDKIAHVYTAGILDTLVMLDAVQTLTNKTLTSPTISGPTLSGMVAGTYTIGGTPSIPASAINSGTLVHERGGLEADVSAYSGLVKITGGTTSAVAAPSGTVVGTTDTQTLSNKTLSAGVTTGDFGQAAWADYAGSSTIAGFSAYSYKYIFYKKIGYTVFVKFGISGTSNGTSFTFSLPYPTATDTLGVTFSVPRLTDGSSVLLYPGMGVIASGSDGVALYPQPTITTWTGSATKMAAGQFFYSTSS